MILLTTLCLFIAASPTQNPLESSAQTQDWAPPTLLPRPDFVLGTDTPVISLDGTWMFSMEPQDGFDFTGKPDRSWGTIQVPGEPFMQGFPILRDVEYPCWRSFEVPSDFAQKRVFLSFEGVYSKSRVWVNGQFAGSHYGGYTSWNLDVTELLTPGEEAHVLVTFIDPTEDPSFGSRYASRYLGLNDRMHPTGGISRHVRLFAVPQAHITSLHYQTDLDASYQDATLSIDVSTAAGATQATPLRIRLADSNGRAAMAPKTFDWAAGTTSNTFTLPIQNPLKWDAEHPNLYTLTAELLMDGVVIERISRKVGFREIEIDGSIFKVNGKPVKLRGGCRHSVHPLAGRADVAGLDERDIKLYKDANINYVRTSHYPTTERFLELADEYGIYIEEEMAICWGAHHAAGPDLQDIAEDPAVRNYFMDAIADTLERDRSHPSIIIWSLGNENTKWGDNFLAERDYARVVDPTRPLKTGHNYYGGGWDTNEYTDIDSMHYPSWKTDFTKVGNGKPYLADEYAHVRCYYGPGSRADTDPNVRSFWGESLKIFWDKMYAADAVLGAAIWGTIDDVFYCEEEPVGYGRWGIFDGWRRLKPEYWQTKKAYSPVRIENAAIGNPGIGKPLFVNVENRFDHTNFNELEISWQVGTEFGPLNPNLAPHSKGQLEIPARAWQDSETLMLEFYATHGGYRHMVDSFALPLTERISAWPPMAGPAPALTQEANGVTAVEGSDFIVRFDNATGQIIEASKQGERILNGGPRLLLSPATTTFALKDFTTAVHEDHVEIHISGIEGELPVDFQVRIDGNGAIQVDYQVEWPAENETKLEEFGVWFEVDGGIDRLSWQRSGLWSTYPSNDIGRLDGIAVRSRDQQTAVYAQEPAWEWYHDMEDFHQHGKEHAGYGMTNDFRGTKEAIFEAAIYREGSAVSLRVESDGEKQAVRMSTGLPYRFQVDESDSQVKYTGAWQSYTDTADIGGTEHFSAEKGATATLTFHGTSISWFGCRNHNLGIADVRLDGKIVAQGIDLYATAKQYGRMLFRADDLQAGEHTLEIIATGRKNADATNAFVLIDAFRDETVVEDAALRLCVVNEWHYLGGWGNYQRTVNRANTSSGSAHLRLLAD